LREQKKTPASPARVSRSHQRAGDRPRFWANSFASDSLYASKDMAR
jgi:hypothetical protein